MYIHYPDEKRCCLSCNSPDQYCTPLKPNWLENGTYKGKVAIADKICNKWCLAGAETINDGDCLLVDD